MAYQVEWTPETEQDLANIWLKAADRKAVTKAQAVADLQLASVPYLKSEEVSEGLHAMTVAPLRIYFEVTEENQVITVTALGVIK